MYSFAANAILALDGMDWMIAYDLAKSLKDQAYGFKVNDLLDDDPGPRAIIKYLSEFGFVFADIKAHDIPNTVANRVTKYAKHGAHLITVHGAGGIDMIRAAVKAYKEHGPPGGLGILVVTVLTSHEEANCQEIFRCSPDEAVLRFAGYASLAGAFGLVCSPKELSMVKARYPHLRRVTPGVRSPGTDTHDQARIDTPRRAFENGAELVVVGREVTKASDPLAAIRSFDSFLGLH